MTSALGRAVFLDRDGVLTEPVLDRQAQTAESPYAPDDVRLVPGATRALAELKRLGFLLVVVSNQPAAAKGAVHLDALQTVHRRALSLLEESGLRLDGWEYCFHHPAGVVPDLTIDCRCRKPRPGMLIRAASRLNIDLTKSWMVGDSDTDVAAGRSVGAHTALAEHPRTGHRRCGTVRADLVVPDLAGFSTHLEHGATVG